MCLCLAAASFGHDMDAECFTRDKLVVNDRGRIVVGIEPGPGWIADDRFTEWVIWVGVGPANTFVDHVIETHGHPVPTNIHADRQKDGHDPCILADWPMSFRGHSRIYKNLPYRILRGRRLLSLECRCHASDKIGGMIIGDILQSIGHAGNNIILANMSYDRILHRFG